MTVIKTGMLRENLVAVTAAKRGKSKTKLFCIMADRGLRSVREGLLFAYQANVIDVVEFAVLVEENKSRELFPYSKFERFITLTIGMTPNAEQN